MNIDKEKVLNLAKSGKGKIVTLALKRWLYAIIAVPALIITYNVFNALNTPGEDGQSVFDKIGDIISEVIDDLVHISYHCPKLITDIHQFTECLGF